MKRVMSKSCSHTNMIIPESSIWPIKSKSDENAFSQILSSGNIMNIIHSLYRKKRPKENLVKYILYLLHLWLGFVLGGIVSFICLTGALYVFKTEVENISVRRYNVRTEEVRLNADKIGEMVETYRQNYPTSPTSIFIPQNNKRNIKISGGERGKPPVIAFFDRQTGELLGKQSPGVSGFFSTLMRLHRWFNLGNRNAGRQIVAGTTLAFLFFLLSGLVLWFPNRRSKHKWKHQFRLRWGAKFSLLNRDLHINLGSMLTLLLILIAYTGIYFTYPGVRQTTLGVFMSREERQLARQQRNSNATQNRMPRTAPEQNEGSNINYAQIVATSNKEMPYKGDLSIYLPGRRSPNIRASKLNTHHFLGARLHDQATFSPQGKHVETKLFASHSPSQKARMLMKSIHTGEILGLKSKILYFILALFAAYLPISGYLMWWKRLKARQK